MDVRIERKEAFQVAGRTIEAVGQADFPKVWDDLYEEFSLMELEALGDGCNYGVAYDYDEDRMNYFKYMAGYDVEDPQEAEHLGLEVLSIPEAEYAVLTLIGKVPNSIHRGWEFLLATYFPEHHYRQALTPNFELYFEGDLEAEDYEMELWIPIEKTA